MTTTSIFVFGLVSVLAAEAANLSPNGPPTTHLKLVVTIDGKSFFADREVLRSWSDAKAFCIQTGMKQAQITSTAQANALVGSFSAEFNGHYWTSGRDAMTYRQFSWDTTNAEVGNYLPFVQAPHHSCLDLVVDGSSSGHYENAACSAKLGTLCET